MIEVDVVIPSFEDKRIEDAINSVYAADLTDVKLTIYVQVGNSAENFKHWISEKFPQVVIGEEIDKNIFDGINKGLSKCSGDYILTIGSDDRVHDKQLFQKLRSKADSGYDYLFCGIEYTDENWRPLRRWPTAKLSVTRYLLGRQYPHFGFLCRPSVYRDIGYFDSSNPTNADYQFFWELAKKSISGGYKQAVIDSYSVQMKLGGNSSQSKTKIFSHNLLLLRFAIKRAPILIPAILVFKWFFKIAEYVRALLR